MKFVSILLVGVLICSAVTQDVESQQDTTQRATEQQQIDALRNIFYSCIVVSRNYLGIGEGVSEQLKYIIDEFGSDQESQLTAWRRIYVDVVKFCANHQTVSGANQIYEELYTGKFDPRNYFYMTQEFNFPQYRNKNIVKDLDPQEEPLWDMIQEFEKKVKEQQDDDDDDDIDYSSGRQQDFSDYEPKLFGVSLKSESKFMELALLLSVFGIFGLVMVAGYRVLTREEPKKEKKKSKKSKKE